MIKHAILRDTFRYPRSSVSHAPPYAKPRRSLRTWTNRHWHFSVRREALRGALILSVVFTILVSSVQGRGRGQTAPKTIPVASPTPYPLATENPNFFNSDKYFYSAEDNNPALHPVPPDIQFGPHRDWSIRCLDWYRLPRTFKGKPSKRDWQYFVTTCECWSSQTLKGWEPTPSPRPLETIKPK